MAAKVRVEAGGLAETERKNEIPLLALLGFRSPH
jgi:hypothetical protein